MSRHRVWLIDEIECSRLELVALLKGTSFQVTGEFSHIESVNIGSYNAPPDLILATMDILSNGGDALTGLSRIHAREPASLIVAFDRPTSLAGLVAAMRGGARAYLESEITRDDLVRALESLVAGEKVLPLELLRHLGAARGPAPNRKPQKGVSDGARHI